MLPTDIADANETYEENPAHEIERQREIEWAAFAAVMRPYLDDVIDAFHTALNLELSQDAYNVFADFRDDEGWPNVLRALARAMEQP